MAIEEEVADGVLRVRTLIANAYVVRTGASWVLVDAGLHGHERMLAQAAADFVGSNAAPAAIVLTHGHFDHVGSLEALLERWDVPVYAHRLERPYLTGGSPYPPPDPLAGRGSMSLMSRLYPRGPIDISPHYRALPDDGTIPVMPDWRVIHTPGHSAGHVSFFRQGDRTLIAGDAVTTTKQESLIAVATQRAELHGPPAYYTNDWTLAGRSAQALAALQPEVLATGHGVSMRGPEMRAQLAQLAANFQKSEIPQYGRYSKDPAVTDEQGIVRLPPDPFPKVLAGLAAAAIAMGLAAQAKRWRRSTYSGERESDRDKPAGKP